MLIALLLLPAARFSAHASASVSASAFLVPSARGGLRLVVAPTFAPKTTIMTTKSSTTAAAAAVGRRRSPRIAQIASSSSTDGVSGGSSSTAFFSTTPSPNNNEQAAGRGKTSSNKKKSNKRRRSNDDDRNGDGDDDSDTPSMVPLSRSSTESTALTSNTDTSSMTDESLKLLPESLSRDLESKILSKKATKNSSKSKSTTTTKSPTSPQPQYFVDNYVIGVDEAGRGPLAGPVVCAAAIVPMRINVTKEEDDGEDDDDPFHPTNLRGVVDSKKLTKEEDREQVYEQLMMMSQPSTQSQPCIRWAVAVIDAKRIDEINILQATMEGMRSAVQTVMGLDATAFKIEDLQKNKKKKSTKKNKKGRKSTINEEEVLVVEETPAPDPPSPTVIIRQVPSASVEEKGCYVVTSDSCVSDKTSSDNINGRYYTLVDGNRLPHDMPCDGESVVKGDSKEFCIAAASILAKVTRDRLMRHYDKLYPQYNLEQHKGYPTAAHMSAVKQHGASPIHRLTFAPLKHMEFDDHGNIIAS